MSVKVMTNVWENSPSRENKLLTLLALADNADDDGWCWPGYERLRAKVRTDRRAIMRLIDDLEAEGEVDVYHRLSEKTHAHLSNAYHLANYGRADAPIPHALRGRIERRIKRSGSSATTSKVVVAEPSGVVVGRPLGVMVGESPRVVVGQPPESSIEPSEEPSDRTIAPSGAKKASTSKKKTTPAEIINPVKDAIVAAFGWDWSSMTTYEVGQVQKAAKALAEAGRAAADVATIHSWCSRQGWKGAFTPIALATHAAAALKTAPSLPRASSFDERVYTKPKPMPAKLESSS